MRQDCPAYRSAALSSRRGTSAAPLVSPFALAPANVAAARVESAAPVGCLRRVAGDEVGVFCSTITDGMTTISLGPLPLWLDLLLLRGRPLICDAELPDRGASELAFELVRAKEPWLLDECTELRRRDAGLPTLLPSP